VPFVHLQVYRQIAAVIMSNAIDTLGSLLSVRLLSIILCRIVWSLHYCSPVLAVRMRWPRNWSASSLGIRVARHRVGKRWAHVDIAQACLVGPVDFCVQEICLIVPAETSVRSVRGSHCCGACEEIHPIGWVPTDGIGW